MSSVTGAASAGPAPSPSQLPAPMRAAASKVRRRSARRLFFIDESMSSSRGWLRRDGAPRLRVDPVGAAVWQGSLFVSTRTRRSTSRAAPPGAARCLLLATIQSPLKLAYDAGQVAMHRRARGFGIVLRDRGENRGMIAYRLLRERMGMEVELRAAPELGALIPEALHDELQGAIAGGLSDPHVELSIACFPHGEVIDVRFHPRDAVAQRLQIVGSSRARCDRRDLAFDQ